jgi:hypothetical protein
MQTWQIVLLIAAVIVVAAPIAWTAMQRRRTQHLAEQYGPEYQRTLEGSADRREAERELQAREERVRRLDIVALSAAARDDYAGRWRVTQADFVDDPSGAISQADGLVQEVMRARGYPMADFEQQAADISVDHPHVVSEYRAGHEIAERAAADGADTEELRQAMVHYRALFEDLLGTNEGEPQGEMSASGPRGEADNGEMPASRATEEADQREPTPAAIDDDSGSRP